MTWYYCGNFRCPNEKCKGYHYCMLTEEERDDLRVKFKAGCQCKEKNINAQDGQ